MIDILLSKLTSEWSEALHGAGITLQPPLSIIQVAGIKGIDRKVNFLIFDSARKIPVLILKVTRSLQHQFKLKQEYECLRQVSAFPSITNSVPRPLGLFEFNSHLVAAESFLPGVSLALLMRRQKRIRPEDIEKDLLSAQTWLQALQKDSGTETRAWSGETIDQLLNSQTDIRLSRFRSDLSEEIRKFDGVSVQLTASHGDFWPGNFLINQDGVGVIDWESFRLRRSPLRDSFLFITTYARSYPWSGWKWLPKGDAFRKGFLENNWFSQQIQKYFERSLQQINLPVSAAHLLFSEFLLGMAKEEEKKGDAERDQWREYLRLYAQNSDHSILRGTL